MIFRFARIPLPTFPVHYSIGNHDKHVSRSSNSKTQADSAVHYKNSDTRAERLPKEKYELQNEEELSVAMVRKKTWVALTRTKESWPYASMATSS